jgi:sigma-B regulation protein RsbU (phosphoserine phosphatase)
MTNPKEKAAAFTAGASDYVGKPVDPNEVAARSRVHLERGLLLRNLRDFKQRVGEELELAKDTQRVLIPADEALREVEAAHGLCLSGHFQTCSELGGDFWDVRSLSPTVFSIYNVDFCGHGVNGALNVFRLHASTATMMDPGVYMADLNAALEPLLPSDQFATMFYGVVDTEKNTLSYAGAGAPPPLLFRVGEAAHEKLDTAGAPLGAWSDVTYPTRTVPFHAGDALLLYSDALTETAGPDGHCLSPDMAAQWFRAELDEGARFAFDALLARFQSDYIPRMKDDLTLVACQRL